MIGRIQKRFTHVRFNVTVNESVFVARFDGKNHLEQGEKERET